MKTITCPSCSTENSIYRSICVNCGGSLAAEREEFFRINPDAAQTEPIQNADKFTSPKIAGKPSQSIPFAKKYAVIKSIANLCNVGAVILALAAGLAGLVGFILLFAGEGEIGLMLIILAILIGVPGYIAFKFLSEAIIVLVDIEMNTRQTAAFTKRILDREYPDVD